jgi:hypothetical protein
VRWTNISYSQISDLLGLTKREICGGNREDLCSRLRHATDPTGKTKTRTVLVFCVHLSSASIFFFNCFFYFSGLHGRKQECPEFLSCTFYNPGTQELPFCFFYVAIAKSHGFTLSWQGAHIGTTRKALN